MSSSEAKPESLQELGNVETRTSVQLTAAVKPWLTYVSAFTSHGTDVSNRESGEVKESGLRDVGQIEAYLRTERGGLSQVFEERKRESGEHDEGQRKSLLFCQTSFNDDLKVEHFCHNHFN